MIDHDAARARAAESAHPDRNTTRTRDQWPDPLPVGATVTDDDGPDLSWHRQAACHGCEVGDWFPERGGSNLEVKAICQACPVQRQCLTYALEFPERFGTWGGASERQRELMRARIIKKMATVTEVVEEFLSDDGYAHGTPAGYRSHQRRRSVPCEACRAAMARYKLDLKRGA